TVSPIEKGAETIRKPVDYIAAKHTIMNSMHERARALGWTMHHHDADHAFLVGDPEGVSQMILSIAEAK
ncbi:MAG: alpha/beta hydrolase, partial [Alphaproteobacteria bacterium]|nr:alpha/beta hydrolase [Alphaproteobacteria bacterium]